MSVKAIVHEIMTVMGRYESTLPVQIHMYNKKKFIIVNRLILYNVCVWPFKKNVYRNSKSMYYCQHNIGIFTMTSDYCCMFLCSFYNAIAR